MTGSAGFIGYHTSLFLKKRGDGAPLDHHFCPGGEIEEHRRFPPTVWMVPASAKSACACSDTERLDTNTLSHPQVWLGWTTLTITIHRR